MRSIVHEAALRYADLGYPVFPCSSGDKVPGTEHGFHDASTDPDQIDRWWTQRPSANVGIPTDGLLVVDVDAEATWLHGKLEWELDLAEGAFSRTPSGGRHFIFRQPDGKAWSSSQGQIAPHVDIRANGGYIVAPPSAIPGGKTYSWVPGNELAAPREQLSLPPALLIAILDGQEHSALPCAGGGRPIIGKVLSTAREEERKQIKKQPREDKQREAVLDALSEFPNGETPRFIRETAGINSQVASQILESLIEEELIEECFIKKHTREERAYRLKTTHSAS